MRPHRTWRHALAILCVTAACGGNVIVDGSGGARTSTTATGAGGAGTSTSTSETGGESCYEWVCTHDGAQGGCVDTCGQILAGCDWSSFCQDVVPGECVNCIRILCDGGWPCP